MSETFDHEIWLSPFAWRYGSPEMRQLWSQAGKRRRWRQVWLAVARAQSKQGLVTAEQVADIEPHLGEVDIEAAHRLEADLKHDLMAELRVFAEQCPLAAPILHLGCTSMDIEDNADALRIRESLDLLLSKVERLTAGFADQIDRWADQPTMGFTHLQPAEPTTVGYRLALHGQDLADDLERLRAVRAKVRGKGFKGATGTSASYVDLLGTVEAAWKFEADALGELGLEAFDAASQTYPRKQDLVVLQALSGLGQTLYRFAFDLRLLQSPPFGEWAEPFGAKQVGSSAMPFKRNPINAENLDSLARLLAALPRVAWDNAAHCLLERTLDDSGNRRVILPQAFLVADEIVRRGTRLIEGLRVDTGACDRLLDTYGTFAATERVMMAAVKAGGNRQSLHETLREHALAAWPLVQAGQQNPLPARLAEDPAITRWVPAHALPELLDARHHVGDAPHRARRVLARLRAIQEN